MKQGQNEPDEEKQSQPKFSIIDRRHKADETTTAEYKPRYPALVEQLQQRLSAKDQQLIEYMDKLQQEHEATKKRLEREVQNRLEREKIQLVSRLLPVLDNLDLALSSAVAKQSY
jgi:molecular chaperone GrpE (heat shock protein)